MDKKNNSMTLFRKLLLSFFSKKAMAQAGLNPAAMFISFVSAKQFFGLVNRRVVEHYKLNMFDIAMDSFEAKVGLGENPSINKKDLDFYYGYNSAANFVGYKFYSPNNIATSLSILSALCTHKHIAKSNPIYFKHLLFTVYIFIFLIIAKIKICPPGDTKSKYDRTMRTFRSLYELVFEKTSTKLSKKTLLHIKNKVMNDVRWSFCIYQCCNYCANYFSVQEGLGDNYYQWLFMDEGKTKTRKIIINHYLQDQKVLSHASDFSDIEKEIIDIVIPADLMIKYIFGDKEGAIITQHVLANLYDEEQLNTIMDSFTAESGNVQELFDFLMNTSQLKKNFFLGIQHYIQHIIKHHLDQEDYQSDENPFSSLIDEEDEEDQKEVEGSIRAIKIETGILDRLINFYISYIGGMQIARGDNGYIRLHKAEFLKQAMSILGSLGKKEASTIYYANIFFLYSKNLFYYSHAYIQVRAGKEDFSIPVKGTIEGYEPNMFAISAIQQNTITTLFQDINTSSVKLFVRKGEILNLFKLLFEKKISSLLKKKGALFIQTIYKSHDSIVTKDHQESLSGLLFPYLNDIDIEKIKDRLYTLDFWLGQESANFIAKHQASIKTYDTMPLLSVLAIMKETFLGLLLYYSYIQSMQESHQKPYYPDTIVRIYCRDILCIDKELVPDYVKRILSLQQQYAEILNLWINLDDNNKYFYIGLHNWISRIETRHDLITKYSLPGEDSIRLLGYIKTISYYNKRYLIPEM